MRVVSVSPVPPTELSPEMEAVLGMEARPKSMSVVVRQEKLLEKLNLDGLAHWSPGNAVVVRELVLAYHDIWAAPVPSSMRYALRMASPSRSSSSVYPLPCWRRCALHSRICWRWGQFIQANHCGATRWYWSGRRMVLCTSVLILDISTCRRRRIHTLLPHIQEALESMARLAHFSSMDFK